ncbi:MAG: rhomboid family intramembrane serine protease [Boseongicola sp.]|nr:rhomboid family intramembrane serine protease [Boseongicola sp.]MDD9979718.1 rhomboid family intramembrane serine protease [Boseongicola sp.]
MSSDPNQAPVVNPLPGVVVGLAVAIFAVELIMLAGERQIVGGADSIGWRTEAIREYAFFAPVVDFLIERGQWVSSEWRRFVTYPFIHLSFTHTLFVIVFLLALGKLVGELMGSIAVVATFFVSAIFGALVYAGLAGDPRPLVGGYPAVYGLIGAYTFILWVTYGNLGESQWRAFTLIGFLLAFQLIFGVLFGSTNDWVAEVAGFAMGFVIAPVTARGGFRRLVDRMRQR